MIAPPMPCTPRARIRKSGSSAAPQGAEASVNRTIPITNIRLRPNRSASDAGGEHARRERQRVGVDHPLQLGERRVERALDRRQRDVHDRDVEQQHEDRRRRPRPASTTSEPSEATYTGPRAGNARRLECGRGRAGRDLATAFSTRCASGSTAPCACAATSSRSRATSSTSPTARAVIDELVELVEGGHQIGSHTVDAVLGTLDAGQDVREVFDAVVWRHRGKKIAPKTVTQKAVRRLDPPLDGHLRDRPGRHRQDVPRDGARGRRAARARGGADHPHAPRGRGGRAARLPAGRPDGEGRPVPAPAVRRALRHARPRQGEHLHGARHDRGRAAGVHARPHAERQLHHPRRGAEHLARADADVPDAARLRLEDRRHRRHHPDRPAARVSAPGLVHVRDVLDRHRRYPVRRVRPQGRRAPQAGAADRRGLQGAHGRAEHDDLGRGRQPERRRGRRGGRRRARGTRPARRRDRRRRARARVRRRGRDARR